MSDRAAAIAAVEHELRAAYDAPAPRVAPRTYPGTILDWSYRINNEGITYLQDYQVAKWIAGRQPVLAVGSNASPAQLRHKFEPYPDLLASVPVTRAIVQGVASVYTPYRAGYGSIPTTAHLDPTLQSLLSVVWLDDDQLARLDETERGGYRAGLVGLPEGIVTEVDGVGEIVEDLVVYVSDSGALLIDGAPATCARFVTIRGDETLVGLDQDGIVAAIAAARPGPLPDSGPIGDLGPPFTVAPPMTLREERQP